MSTTERFYPQPSGWGAVSVGRTLLQDRTDLHTRPVDTWKVKLPSVVGSVWDPQGKVLPQTQTFLHLPRHRAAEGQRYWEKRNPTVSPQKFFVSTPSKIFAPTPPRVGSIMVTLGILEKWNIFQSSWDYPTVHPDLDLSNKIKKYQN